MSQETKLLQKLYDFYSSRYNGKSLETKFNDAVYDLVKTGDVKNATYVEFCIDNDIEPTVETKPRIVSSVDREPIRRYTDDGCGGRGGGYYRSAC